MKIQTIDNGRGIAFDYGHCLLPGILKSNALPAWGVAVNEFITNERIPQEHDMNE
jgi:hypothetical protein